MTKTLRFAACNSPAGLVSSLESAQGAALGTLGAEADESRHFKPSAPAPWLLRAAARVLAFQIETLPVLCRHAFAVDVAEAGDYNDQFMLMDAFHRSIAPVEFVMR